MATEILRKYINIVNENSSTAKQQLTEGWKTWAGAIGGGLIGGIPGAAIGGLIGRGLEDDVSTAYANGQEAFKLGIDEEENPYSEGSENWWAWHQGWEEAQAEGNDYENDEQSEEVPEPKQTLPQIKTVATKGNIDTSNTNDPRAKYRTNKTNKYFKP